MEGKELRAYVGDASVCDAIGLSDDMTPEEIRAWWTARKAVQVAKLDGEGRRQGLVASIDAALGTSVLVGADLSRRDLRGACFDRVIADRASFDRARLRGASFKQARLNRASFNDASLRGVNFYEASLERAEFIGARMDGANLAFVWIRGADFDFANGVLFDATTGDPKSYDLVNLRRGPCGH